MAFVRFSAREFKTPQKPFGESPCQKPFTKKLKGERLPPAISSLRFVVSRFWPFLCTMGSKTPGKYVQK
jgi:hypothetical protein